MTTIYNIDQNTEVRETSSIPAMLVGINENVNLISVSKETAKNNRPYLCFHFKDSQGNELKHMEWDIDANRITPKPNESIDEAVQRRTNMMLVRIKHICTKFITEDKFIITANDFNGLCDSIVDILGGSSVDKNVRIKVVYSWNDYASLPGFPPFIEVQTEDETKLRINTQYDKMEKTGKKVEEEVKTSEETDLPF